MSKILFVGGFNLRNDPNVYGGQLTACLGLINSKLKEEYQFVLVDSTNYSLEHRAFFIRIIQAISRLYQFIFKLLRHKNIAAVFIFSSGGFSFYEKGQMVFISKFFRKKTLLFPRSGLIKNHVEKSNFFKNYVTRVVNRADFVICQDKNWFRFYEPLISNTSTKCAIIHNWIEAGPLTPNNPSYDKLSPVNVMFLGHLYEYKGILDFLEMAKILSSQSSEIIFNIYGDGPLKDQVIKKIADIGNEQIIYHGIVHGKDKSIAFMSNQIFVLPSHIEGLPNVLLESMAYGLGVVATNVGAVSSVIENDLNGLLVEPGRVDEIVRSVTALIEDKVKLKRLSSKARLDIIDKFSSEQAAKKLKELI